MYATRYCLSVVRKGQPPPTGLPIGPNVEEISDFLVSHARGLRRGTTERANEASKAAPLTRFLTKANTEAQFQDLAHGSDDEFLAAARTFTTDLITQMGHKNAKEGVLVCATFEDAGQMSAAALKLEVVSEHGAFLEGLESGRVTLTAIQQVLDRPGDLQKGVVYPDPRPDSDAIVADRVNQTEAQYFLTAVGIEVIEPGKSALGIVAQTLSDAVRPEDRVRVIRQLQDAEGGEVDEVVTAAIAEVQMAPAAPDLLEMLRGRDRPVRTVDTRYLIKTKLVAGRVKIELGGLDPENVTVEASSGGGWDIKVHVDTEPTWQYSS